MSFCGASGQEAGEGEGGREGMGGGAESWKWHWRDGGRGKC